MPKMAERLSFRSTDVNVFIISDGLLTSEFNARIIIYYCTLQQNTAKNVNEEVGCYIQTTKIQARKKMTQKAHLVFNSPS